MLLLSSTSGKWWCWDGIGGEGFAKKVGSQEKVKAAKYVLSQEPVNKNPLDTSTADGGTRKVSEIKYSSIYRNHKLKDKSRNLPSTIL